MASSLNSINYVCGYLCMFNEKTDLESNAGRKPINEVSQTDDEIMETVSEPVSSSKDTLLFTAMPETVCSSHTETIGVQNVVAPELSFDKDGTLVSGMLIK
jgi:hypothetical protein